MGGMSGQRIGSRICRRLLGAVLAVSITALLGPTVAQASDQGFTTLDVGGEEVRIYRDGFGIPHIFAETDRGLFEAYGYTVAKDRLWQLELNRRAARGRLADIFGSPVLPSDVFVRTTGYTDAELDAQFNQLSAEEQEIFNAYAAGINRYINEVIAPNPLKLPFEFHALGISPAPWTTRDSVAFGVFMTRRFGEIGGRERTNASVLSRLITAHGASEGLEIFNDVRWINDPDSPTTVPTRGAVGKRQEASFEPAQLRGSSGKAPEIPGADAREVWESNGIVSRLGSYAWAVSPARSAEGAAMLYGGPQMGFSAPEVLHEVQLKNNDDLNVTGMAFAGVPLVLIGRNQHIAWTSTTGIGDNLDHYAETLCDAGSGYIFNGTCTPFEVRNETINVRGEAPVNLPVRRSVHGPVVATSGGTAFTQKRSHWQRELEATSPFLEFDRASDIGQFEEALQGIPTSHNFLYADESGNIGYWQAGQVPIRPAGFDARLPLPGDGSAEWPGGYLPIPRSINPQQGYLANWNNKPSVDFNNPDSSIFGKQFRLRDIDDRLATGQMTLADMRDIPKDIARVKGLGREARFLKPYLLGALAAVPPSHPVAPAAKAVLQAWDGNAFADAVTSTNLEAGEVLFSTWLSRILSAAFADELGLVANEASSNMLIHVLDDAFGGGSGVPPSRDYFNGADPNAVMSAVFDQTVAALVAAQGPNPAAWTSPRGVTRFDHPIIGTVGTIPTSNRATYAQIAVLTKPTSTAENIFTLGQSGFIGLVPPSGFALDPHFDDLLSTYRNFGYKPMRLFRNTQLQE
jgi:penicillin amidase